MYEEYIKSERTPAGKVLEHILRKARLTRSPKNQYISAEDK